MRIRRADADEWEHIRDLRLRALLDAPDVAIALYERCGFTDTAERGPLREGSEILVMKMRKALR